MDLTESILNTSTFSNNDLSMLHSQSSVSVDIGNILIVQIVIGVLTCLLTVWTILGNCFVLYAISTNRVLLASGLSNWLIGNLAISDLLLGSTVLPFSASFSTFKKWFFGRIICHIWLYIDVFCCTASIWCLCFIALDRFIATYHPVHYRTRKNGIRTKLYYCLVPWLISLLICVAPIILDYLPIFNTTTNTNTNNNNTIDSNYNDVNNDNKNTTWTYNCVLFNTPLFVLVSSFFSFYLPAIIMVVLYARVFMKISQQSKRFRRNIGSKKSTKKSNVDSMTSQQDILKDRNEPLKEIDPNKNLSKPRPSSIKSHVFHSLLPHNHSHFNNQISSAEKHITKTLAIIMSCFISCWLPFFIIYIARSLVSDATIINDSVMDIFIWLGYINSSLNPIIYLIVNVNFRNSLIGLLSAKCN